MDIIIYDERYKERLLAMVTEARLALGLSSEIRADLYDVRSNYLDKGDMFRLAENSRRHYEKRGYHRIKSASGRSERAMV